MFVTAAVAALAADRVVGALTTGSTIKETRGLISQTISNKEDFISFETCEGPCGQPVKSLPAAVLPLTIADADDLLALVLSGSADDQNTNPDLLTGHYNTVLSNKHCEYE